MLNDLVPCDVGNEKLNRIIIIVVYGLLDKSGATTWVVVMSSSVCYWLNRLCVAAKIAGAGWLYGMALSCVECSRFLPKHKYRFVHNRLVLIRKINYNTIIKGDVYYLQKQRVN